MYSALILLAITLATLLGDYCIKTASSQPVAPPFSLLIVGGFLYGAPAIGWYFLMKQHSLAAIGVFYSSTTILMLAAMGYFAFGEILGPREFTGLILATLSVIVMSHA